MTEAVALSGAKKRKLAQLAPAFEPMYKAGEWNPVLRAGGVDFGVVSEGTYVKIGALVTVQAYIDITNSTGPTGTIMFDVPFPTKSAPTARFSTLSMRISQVSLTAGYTSMFARLGIGSAEVTVVQQGSPALSFNTVDASALTNSSFIYISGTYIAEEDS